MQSVLFTLSYHEKTQDIETAQFSTSPPLDPLSGKHFTTQITLIAGGISHAQ